MLQVESVLPQKLLQNQNTKSKQSKYIIISLDFALFHFIMLFLGNNREVPSFITQLSDLNLEDHLGDCSCCLSFPTPCDLHYCIAQKWKHLWQNKGGVWKTHPEENKRKRTGTEAFVGVHPVSLGAPTWDSRHRRRTPTYHIYLHPYLGEFFRSYGEKLFLTK